MKIELTNKEFRRLLDLVYIGNWVLNSTREEDDRIEEYDKLESKLFQLCGGTPFAALVETEDGEAYPSRAFEEGGIHEAIAYYEDGIFYDLLAEELVKRDMGYPELNEGNYPDYCERLERYMEEFEESGIDNLTVEGME